MKHILFIESSASGAGELTFSYAKSKGYQVSLLTTQVDQYPKSLLSYLDHIEECDTQDYQAIKAKVTELHKTHKFNGITTTADLFVPKASFAASLCHLPSMPYESAITARFKHLTRLQLDQFLPELNPNFAIVKSFEEAEKVAVDINYPFIAKLSNGNDSIHVKLITDVNELAHYFLELTTLREDLKGYQLADEILLEAYLDGPEFSVETVQAMNGERQLLGVTSKESQEDIKAGFAETCAAFPYQGEYQKALVEKVFKALDALKINCGVIHTECRVVNGEVKILEINPRLIGDNFGSHAMVLALGFNPAHLVVDVALNDFKHLPKSANKGVAWSALTTKLNGTFEQFENLDQVQTDFQIDHIFPRKVEGDIINGIGSNGDILALVITQGEDIENATSKAKKATQAITYTLR